MILRLYLGCRIYSGLVNIEVTGGESKCVHQRQIFLHSSQNPPTPLPLGTLEHILQPTGPIDPGFEQCDLLAVEVPEEQRTLGGVGVQLVCVRHDTRGLFV